MPNLCSVVFPRFWKIIIASLFISIAIASVAIIHRSREPVWAGKPISAWCSQYADLNQDRSDAAKSQLQGIGKAAIPFLVKQLQDNPRSAPFDSQKSVSDSRSEAVLVFRLLGTNAESAIPTLSNMLTNSISATNLDSAIAVAESLASTGPASKPLLLAALSNPSRNIRFAALAAFGDFGTEAKAALPIIEARLNDSDGEIRSLALYFSVRFCDSREKQRELLLGAQKDVDSRVRSFAIGELNRMDHEAEGRSPENAPLRRD